MQAFGSHASCARPPPETGRGSVCRENPGDGAMIVAKRWAQPQARRSRRRCCRAAQPRPRAIGKPAASARAIRSSSPGKGGDMGSIGRRGRRASLLVADRRVIVWASASGKERPQNLVGLAMPAVAVEEFVARRRAGHGPLSQLAPSILVEAHIVDDGAVHVEDQRADWQITRRQVTRHRRPRTALRAEAAPRSALRRCRCAARRPW